MKSHCPVCRDGILPVLKMADVTDSSTETLLRNDRCLHCGQSFEYLDIIDFEQRILEKEDNQE